MNEFVLEQQNVAVAPQQEPQDKIRRLVWRMCVATLILMAIGSATRVMNAGLACPDWPLCYGELVPTKQMNFQVFLEWFHRLDAALIGISAIALVGLSWWHRRSLPKWLPWASTFALFLIVFQLFLFFIVVCCFFISFYCFCSSWGRDCPLNLLPSVWFTCLKKS